MASRFLGALSVLGEVLGSSTRQLLGPNTGGIQEWAAAASKASITLQALNQLEQQDKALVHQRWPMAPVPTTNAAANTPADSQQQPDLQAVISQLKQLQRLVPEQRLERLSRWALQEGLGELVIKGRSGGSGSAVSNSTRLSDPFGILMAYQGGGHAIECLTPTDYVLDVCVMRHIMPELVQCGVESADVSNRRGSHRPASPPPTSLLSVMRYCQGRRALVTAWQLLSMKDEPQVAKALQERLHQMCAESASLRSYCQRLLTWHAAHQLMLARDEDKVDMNLLRLQLEGKQGSSIKESKAKQALDRVERLWADLLTQVGASTTPTDFNQTNRVTDPPTRVEVAQQCDQLMHDLNVVNEALTPHKNIHLEVSVIISEYQEMIREYGRHTRAHQEV